MCKASSLFPARASSGPPQRWARVHCTLCTPCCYATDYTAITRGVLNVQDRTFKLVVVFHRCLNGRAPQYLTVHCIPLSSQRHLRTAEWNMYPVTDSTRMATPELLPLLVCQSWFQVLAKGIFCRAREARVRGGVSLPRPLKFGAEVGNSIWCLWKSTYHVTW